MRLSLCVRSANPPAYRLVLVQCAEYRGSGWCLNRSMRWIEGAASGRAKHLPNGFPSHFTAPAMDNVEFMLSPWCKHMLTIMACSVGVM